VHGVIVPEQVFVHVHPLCAWQVVCAENVPHADGVPEQDVPFHAHPAMPWQPTCVFWIVHEFGVPEQRPDDAQPAQLLQP
jgi:hypothetical protein